MRLQKKTALVTGATSGIGEAMAYAFAREGAHVVITGRNAQRGQAVVDAIRDAGGSAHFVIADLTSREAINDLVSQTQTAVGKVRSRIISVDDRKKFVLVDDNFKRLSDAAFGFTLHILYPIMCQRILVSDTPASVVYS
jgi:NAD(P)-dependent dehydrogenase (short-subunit alcohol dehydrogenase family)